MSDRIGFWVDMDNPYVTYHNDYIESEWWALKEIWKKGLLYKGHKVVPYCPRCGTALSSHEVSQGYKDVKETSIYVKFKLKNKNKYMLAWTTTPWTLPNNMALAVNENYDYVEVLNKGEHLILAEALLNKLEDEYRILKKFKGTELVGLDYEPMFNFVSFKGRAHYVIHADYVTLTDGTGIVHTAPAFGEDDSKSCKKYDIPMTNSVDTQGRFKEEVTP